MCMCSCTCGHVLVHMHICRYVCPCMCVSTHACSCVCVHTQTIWHPPCFPLSHLFSAVAASRHIILETSGSPLTPSPSLPLVNNLASSSHPHSHGLTRPPSSRFVGTLTPTEGPSFPLPFVFSKSVPSSCALDSILCLCFSGTF